MKLTEKRQRFVDEYIIDSNATQAAIRAGYSRKTAKSQGQRLLTNVDIQEAIKKRMDEKEQELIMKQNEILIRLSEQARREAIDHRVVLTEKPTYDDNGNFLGIEKKPEIVELPTQNRDSFKAMELLLRRYPVSEHEELKNEQLRQQIKKLQAETENEQTGVKRVAFVDNEEELRRVMDEYNNENK